MSVLRCPVVLLLCLILQLAPNGGQAEDLIDAQEGMVRYKLSNMRVNQGITGDEISFDYRRTKEGTGRAQVAARTDHGASRILGLPIRIDASGTIHLKDMFARSRRIINPGNEDFGIEFYFIVEAAPGFGPGGTYLVSNSVVHGKMNSRVQSRPPNEEELAAIEMERKSKVPPESLPPGYVRGTNEMPLVPGAPVMIGSVGEWKPAVVVAPASSRFVKVLAEDSKSIRTIQRQDWIAVSEETLEQIKSNPQQFSINIRTLPKGDLVLDDDMHPLESAMSLLKGTPLLREKYGKWENVYFISSDNVSVRVMIRGSGTPKVEFVPIDSLAIREQTLKDQQSDAAKDAFAANIADFENFTKPTAGGSGAMASSGGLSSGGRTADSMASGSLSPAPTSNASITDTSAPSTQPSLGPERQWSDQTGKFKIDAQLVKQEDGKVFLRRADGRTIEVPISKLSRSDQSYLTGLASTDESPFTNVVESPVGGNVDYGRVMQPVMTVGDLKWGAKSVAVSPDNRFLLIGRKGAAATLTDLTTGQTLVDSGRMDHMGDIGVCGFTPDGRRMVMGGAKGVFEVYEADDKGKLQLRGQYPLHEKEITALAFSSDGKHAFSGDAGKVARYWDVESGEPIATVEGFDGKIKATRITPSGKLLLATDGKTLKSFSVDESKVVGELSVGRSHASGQAAAISSDGTRLATGDGYKIDLWDLTKQQKLPTMEGKEINWSMTFAPDNRHLISGGNGVVFVWDCERQMKLQTNTVGKSFYVQAVAVSPDGSLVAAPSEFSSVAVLRAQ
ncbi:SHD1 domain-containing protein [Aporhodopirellula aestuarii]|uniref:SHD1 domain-containing protein n=1 Tax=Aporhodopirellula aestuarii TaxID=2950107 RepID=A0ABT0UC12_9BACT|nr:SHD1 domain-containing protein [Aporhodopirellula aestuarii]MCM2374542.1 SHD1 domain-containing protein [Aporhodopirellula aestuarii]